ncbi:MAG: hypothetical protein IPJ98_04995 [Bryobacterales bacterium]|nr:hypothetical protein [Bryobacterales bacterium]
MPGEADSNSPAHWVDGTLYLFNSNGNPVRTQGPSFRELRAARAVLFYDYDHPQRWIESTWLDDDGTLYAWYHREAFVCPDEGLSAPEIGALVSYDNGATFFDLGIVLRSGDLADCGAGNGYFAGGHGDFTVVLDRERQYFYFLFSNYGGPVSRQGIALARMALEDRANPTGNVWKWDSSAWEQPGLEGAVTPILPVVTGWGAQDTDAYWGPSVHWNTYLNQWVMLMNHSCCTPGWPQEGVYISFAADIAQPGAWTRPQRILEGGPWYPQVLGMNEGETDKEAGDRARVFTGAWSEWELVFSR